MAEALGGSRKGDNLGGSKLAGSAQRPGVLGGSQRAAGGGILSATGRPSTARNNAGASKLGAGPPARPASAPRDRPSPSGGTTLQGSSAARARVEELRQLKEAQYWGRDVPAKRDLPAYWSLAAFGQPFNDERLFNGANNHYQLLEPAGLKPEDARVVGPATEQQATLRKSLQDGKRYFDLKDLSPLRSTRGPPQLSDEDRVLIMSKLTACQRVHALRNCLDRDGKAAGFVPWTQMVWDRLDANFWRRNKEMAIRLAVQKLENLMRRHLLYMSEQRCQAARAPAARLKDVLREAFWKVDPAHTGHVSLQQFLHVWQNVLCLVEYSDAEVRLPNGRKRVVLQPGRRFVCDLNMTAAIFVKYGFDKDGLMPYVVFSQALCAAPARLLGQELVLDKAEEGKHGLSSEVDVAFCQGDAKIIYPKCEQGVFPPSGFDHRVAERSSAPPSAHLQLEHVYGYAGMDTLQSNVFYTHNTASTSTEVVYYVGCVGVVLNKELFDAGKPCQRFFFGHDNDILCMAMHPNRKFVATGQQKATGKLALPYVCVWDVDHCNLLQRLDHDEEMRAVLVVGFSGNINAPTEDKQGGDLLISITGDDKHTIHIWRWMKNANKFVKARNIPGWFIGPSKKLEALKGRGVYYKNHEDKDDEGKLKPWLATISTEEAQTLYKQQQNSKEGLPPMVSRVASTDYKVDTVWEQGYCDAIPCSKDDGTWEKLHECPGCNGTPPMVYGVVWNPFRPQDGRRGTEFCTYGVKHIKTWIVNEQDQWQGAAGSFGTDHIENVLSAVYVPAMHYMAAPGDSCILTGFASGQVGLWVPPYPTRAGSTYALTRKFGAHGPGVLRTLNDGTQQYGGVRAIKLRADPSGKDVCGRVVVTGGSDGCVVAWQLEEVTGTRKDGTPLRGVNLKRLAAPEEKLGPNRFLLQGIVAPYEDPSPPSITALDCHPAKPTEFIAGTDGCDIWEVDNSPRVLIEGHEEDIYTVTTHPEQPHVFATGATSGKVRIWDMKKRDVLRAASIGTGIAGLAFSNEKYAVGTAAQGKAPVAYHLAIGSAGGYEKPELHRIIILNSDTLQPLHVLKDPQAQVLELKYSPVGGPGILAAGGCDMTVYLYNAQAGYQLITKCIGHSGNVEHIDWSLPISLPGSKLHGTMILQASDTSGNLLYWNPRTGKKIPYTQRDAPWDTWTTTIGFPVMGIWPDDSDRTDVNAVCRAKRATPKYLPPANVQNLAPADIAASVQFGVEQESADGVPGCSYLATGDDFSTVRLFNFPVVWDDAPYKAFRGHASHVMAVRFNADDRYVVSAGGHDRAIFQWRTYGVAQEDAEQDKKLLAMWKAAIEQRSVQDSALQPAPGVEWVALDKDGKIFGPRAVKDAAAAAPAAGATVRQ